MELPKLKTIIPYIGLFTLVTINPTQTARNVIPTTHLPSLSIKHGTKFVVAPPNTSATAMNVARIFDPLAIDVDTPLDAGIIPISPDDEAFEEKRYWRLPVSAAAIFAALIARLQYDLSDCEDIILANRILASLISNRHGVGGGAGGPSGGRGSGRRGGRGRGDGGRGGGLSGGEGRQSKRKDGGGESSASTEKGKKKARNVAGGDGAEDGGESSNASGKALRSFWVPLVPSWNVEFPPGLCSQDGQSDHREIASSTLGDDMPAILLDADKNNSDSEAGRSEHS